MSTASLQADSCSSAWISPSSAWRLARLASSTALSYSPYLSTEVVDANKGDTVTVAWVDNMGEQASADAKVK